MASSGNVTYGAADSVVSRGPSPIIWADCPSVTFIKDPSKGFEFYNDFKSSVYGSTSPEDSAANGDMFVGYVESNVTDDLALVASSNIGELQIIGDGTDQDVYCITTGNNTAGIVLTPKEGETKKFWYEARVKVSTITDGDMGVFVGLAQPGEAKDAGGVFGGDAAALADVDYIGFAVLEGDGDDLTLVYNEATSGVAQSTTGEITLVADTYVRLGIKLVVNGNSIKIRYYKDGVDLGDDVAVNIGSSDANWPGDTKMDLVVSHVAGSGAADSDAVVIDWIRVAQEY